jgi:thiamine biosynthesis lipoprotein
VFDAEGRVGHIIDPRTGRPGGIWRQVTVISPSAARADGLSTAFALTPRPDIDRALEAGEAAVTL